MQKSEAIVAAMMNMKSVEEKIESRLNAEHPYKPYITFSREPGSGGKPIAKLVAKKLGYKFYDKKLVDEVSLKMHRSTGLLKRVDEHRRSGIMDMVQGMLNPDYVSDETYFRNLCLVIYDLVQKGGVVIVGRGANFVVPQAYGLQVRVTAPYRVRVARAIQYEKIDNEEARERIRRDGEQRARFVKQYFGKNILRAKYYDLTINTTFYTVQQAADLVLEAYKLKFPKGRVSF